MTTPRRGHLVNPSPAQGVDRPVVRMFAHEGRWADAIQIDITPSEARYLAECLLRAARQADNT